MTIGYAMCGSFCTHTKSLEILVKLREYGHDILPIMSEITATTDTRFGKSKDLMARVEEICQNEIIKTIVAAEPLGPKMATNSLSRRFRLTPARAV